ncbi:hypothetical protein [Ekhidna sp.]
MINQKSAKRFAFLGVFILLIGISNIFLPRNEVEYTQSWYASLTDSLKSCDVFISGHRYPEGKVIIHESFDLEFEIGNTGDSCLAQIQVQAAAFEVSGPSGQFWLHGITNMSWNVLPKYLGDQSINVKIGDRNHRISLKVIKPTYDNLRDLISVLGWILGPLLTVPFWITKFQERKKNRGSNEKSVLYDSSGNPIENK